MIYYIVIATVRGRERDGKEYRFALYWRDFSRGGTAFNNSSAKIELFRAKLTQRVKAVEYPPVIAISQTTDYRDSINVCTYVERVAPPRRYFAR